MACVQNIFVFNLQVKRSTLRCNFPLRIAIVTPPRQNISSDSLNLTFTLRGNDVFIDYGFIILLQTEVETFVLPFKYTDKWLIARNVKVKVNTSQLN